MSEYTLREPVNDGAGGLEAPECCHCKSPGDETPLAEFGGTEKRLCCELCSHVLLTGRDEAKFESNRMLNIQTRQILDAITSSLTSPPTIQ
jgi:hypothetical protein